LGGVDLARGFQVAQRAIDGGQPDPGPVLGHTGVRVLRGDEVPAVREGFHEGRPKAMSI
jgi:hypothetical protein